MARGVFARKGHQVSKNTSPNLAALLQQGLAFHQQGRLADAQACYAQVLARDAVNPDAWHLLGVVLGAQGNHDAGIRHLLEAIRLQPAFAAAHKHLGYAYYNLGNAQMALGDYAAALAAYQAGLARQPEDGEMLLALAKAHHRHGHAAEALAVLARVLALAPLWADAHNTLGAVREQNGEMAAARAAYRQAVALAPDLTDAQLNLGTAELCLGNFAAGWHGYAYRPQHGGGPDPLACARRALTPGALAGKTVLLYAEQGLGDTLQFARYAPLLAAAGATVGLVVQPPLKTLLAASLPGVSVFTLEDAVPAAAEHLPLLSLPLVFGTTLASIPSPVPYVLPDRATVARWAARLPRPTAGAPRIGVAWSGNPRHENDARRSIPLALFATLMTCIAGVFCGLQTEIGPADRACLASLPNFVDLAPEIGDFVDTAAIIENLDLVITVDTSIAHLAGTLGKPVWLLLPFVPDWRWLLEREDSPWYPGMRLVRQRTAGDWPEVLRRVALALRRDYATG
jgi:tetratricopeptide (TPR) repeat protein